MHETPTWPAQRSARGEAAPRVRRAHLRLLPPADPCSTRTPASIVFLADRRERAAVPSVAGVDRLGMLAWCARVVLPAVAAHQLGRLKHALVR